MRKFFNTKLNPFNKSEKGFTIVELLVVIAIISVIAAIAIPTFFNYTAKSAQATVKSDVKNTVTAITAALVEDSTLGTEALQAEAVITGDNIITVGGSGYDFTVTGSSTDPRLSDWAYSYANGIYSETNGSGGGGLGGGNSETGGDESSSGFKNIIATGGTIQEYTIDGITYKAHIFTNIGTSTFTVNDLGDSNGEVEYLIVAGGGAGGSGSTNGAGGGGAGGLLTGTTTVLVNDYNITVGNGAASRGINFRGLNGEDSSAFDLTAIGGGGGAPQSAQFAGRRGSDGGSGGGGSGGSNFQDGTIGLGTTGQGNNGGMGKGATLVNESAGGGGGGAGAVGQTATLSQGGNGGVGIQSSISGTPTYYAGGGGGSNDMNAGTGGLGGGGNGATNEQTAQNAADNTGGGGGAGLNGNGGAGGSGIVIIRYPIL